MNIHQITAFIVMASATTVVLPGGVYKCKSDDGSVVYSGIPCSPKAEKVRIQKQNPSVSSTTGLRPGEVEAVNKIRQKELQERARRTTEQPAEESLSYSDRQRLEELQREKNRILHSDGHRKLTASQRSALLKSIDAEIAAIRGVPIITQNYSDQTRRRTPGQEQPSEPQQLLDTSTGTLLDTSTGTVMPRAAGGYIDPRTGTFYQDAAGGVVNTRTGEFSPTH